MSQYYCERCREKVEMRVIVCSVCLADFYQLHSLWMEGLKHTEAPRAQEVKL